MNNLQFTIISSNDALARALEIRRTVFIEEQGISEEIEMDENDSSAMHILVENHGEPAGTARLRFTADKLVKLERMAVLKPLRGTGIGKGIVSFVEKECLARRIEHITLNAQHSAVNFYRACGFKETGPPFLEAGINHIGMDKELQ